MEENYNISRFEVLFLNTWLEKYRIIAIVMDIFHQILKVKMIGRILTFLSTYNMY